MAVSVKAWTNSPRDRTAAAGRREAVTLGKASPLCQNGARHGNLSSPAFPGNAPLLHVSGRISQAEEPEGRSHDCKASASG